MAFLRLSVSLNFQIMLLPLALFFAAITAVVHDLVVVNSPYIKNRVASRTCFVFINIMCISYLVIIFSCKNKNYIDIKKLSSLIIQETVLFVQLTKHSCVL
jgi:hypothetical protein